MFPSYSHCHTPAPSWLLRSFGLGQNHFFHSILTAQDLISLFATHKVFFGRGGNTIFTPVLTLWALLSQCLAVAKDCASAVCRVASLRASFAAPPCSNATGTYCIARGKLPIDLLSSLCHLAGDRLEDQAPLSWRWQGRRVVLVDGTTLSGPDTPANQEAYPQSHAQKPGLGFPLIRMVVLLGLSTGALLGAAFSPWRGKGNGESSLLLRLLDRLRPQDVLVGDRIYCGYRLLSILVQRGVDACFRVQQLTAVQSPKRCQRRLGEGDFLVYWNRTDRSYLSGKRDLPERILVREIHTEVNRPGFRVRHMVLVSTLTECDSSGHPLISGEALRHLYRCRWHVELDIRSLKTWMNMDILRGKTPEMMRREIWGHLLAHNLVRCLQAEAAQARGCTPRDLSFTMALKQLRENHMLLSTVEPDEQHRLVEAMVAGAGSRRVGNRPDRYEPRRVKRRPKHSKLLNKPRAEARQEVVAGVEAMRPKTIRKRKGRARPESPPAAG